MGETNSSTLERIHAAAQAEFLKKGYQGASLRNIVKTAGVTTGALYGYYDSKEALFAALVDESYRHVLDTYRAAVFGFEALRPEEQVAQMGDVGKNCMRELLTYMDARSHLSPDSGAGRGYPLRRPDRPDGDAGGGGHGALHAGAAEHGQDRARHRPAAGAHVGDGHDECLLRDHHSRHAHRGCPAVQGGTGRLLHGGLAENYGAVMLYNFSPAVSGY